jgi:hypothetical protein
MCNLYSMTRNREVILRLFRISPALTLRTAALAEGGIIAITVIIACASMIQARIGEFASGRSHGQVAFLAIK